MPLGDIHPGLQGGFFPLFSAINLLKNPWIQISSQIEDYFHVKHNWELSGEI